MFSIPSDYLPPVGGPLASLSATPVPAAIVPHRPAPPPPVGVAPYGVGGDAAAPGAGPALPAAPAPTRLHRIGPARMPRAIDVDINQWMQDLQAGDFRRWDSTKTETLRNWVAAGRVQVLTTADLKQMRQEERPNARIHLDREFPLTIVAIAGTLLTIVALAERHFGWAALSALVTAAAVYGLLRISRNPAFRQMQAARDDHIRFRRHVVVVDTTGSGDNGANQGTRLLVNCDWASDPAKKNGAYRPRQQNLYQLPIDPTDHTGLIWLHLARPRNPAAPALPATPPALPVT